MLLLFRNNVEENHFCKNFAKICLILVILSLLSLFSLTFLHSTPKKSFTSNKDFENMSFRLEIITGKINPYKFIPMSGSCSGLKQPSACFSSYLQNEKPLTAFPEG